MIVSETDPEQCLFNTKMPSVVILTTWSYLIWHSFIAIIFRQVSCSHFCLIFELNRITKWHFQSFLFVDKET